MWGSRRAELVVDVTDTVEPGGRPAELVLDVA
jgi:hypothetical protein